MIILSVHPGHDAAAALFEDYELLGAVQLERLSRRKSDGFRFPSECVDELLSMSGLDKGHIDVLALSRSWYPSKYVKTPFKNTVADTARKTFLGRKKLRDISRVQRRKKTQNPFNVFKYKSFLANHGFPKDTRIHFYNHHLSHALTALFYNDWDDVLLYTADGGGDHVHYSVRSFKDGELQCFFGDDEWLLRPTRIDSLGQAYSSMTEALGFKRNRHEGKLTGLAAYGQPTLLPELQKWFFIEDNGTVMSTFHSNAHMKDEIFKLAREVPREDAACSIQLLLEEKIVGSVRSFRKKSRNRYLGLAGGVFANVRLNAALAQLSDIDGCFIFPAMGDEGLCVGGALDVLLKRDGQKHWTQQRRKLKDVYLGKDYTHTVDDYLKADSTVKQVSDQPELFAAARIEENHIVALFDGRPEFGPRALGARSILAHPGDETLNDTLNKRLQRSEFMPFAPVILEDDVTEVFNIGREKDYTAHFMTITCQVKEEWKHRIPAVVHVDGTARPQILNRRTHPFYAGIIDTFKQQTGIPVLVNTSFNAHEEPMVYRPKECLNALKEGRVDYVITRNGAYQCSLEPTSST